MFLNFENFRLSIIGIDPVDAILLLREKFSEAYAAGGEFGDDTVKKAFDLANATGAGWSLVPIGGNVNPT